MQIISEKSRKYFALLNAALLKDLHKVQFTPGIPEDSRLMQLIHMLNMVKGAYTICEQQKSRWVCASVHFHLDNLF